MTAPFAGAVFSRYAGANKGETTYNQLTVSCFGVRRALAAPPAIPAEGPKLQTNLDAGILKLIMATAIFIGHIGSVFFTEAGDFRWLGRLAFPVFCCCLTVGLLYTHDIKRYLGAPTAHMYRSARSQVKRVFPMPSVVGTALYGVYRLALQKVCGALDVKK